MLAIKVFNTTKQKYFSFFLFKNFAFFHVPCSNFCSTFCYKLRLFACCFYQSKVVISCKMCWHVRMNLTSSIHTHSFYCFLRFFCKLEVNKLSSVVCNFRRESQLIGQNLCCSVTKTIGMVQVRHTFSVNRKRSQNLLIMREVVSFFTQIIFLLLFDYTLEIPNVQIFRAGETKELQIKIYVLLESSVAMAEYHLLRSQFQKLPLGSLFLWRTYLASAS